MGAAGDWIGLQSYTRARIDSRLRTLIVPWDPEAPTTQMGWEVHSASFGEMLSRIAAARLPIVVTENGIGTADDRDRLAYLASHLEVLRQVMQEGVDVRGYLHWSAFDNFEWNRGYTATFGLVAIDRSNGLRRVSRPSAEAFGRLARTGRLDELRRLVEPVEPVPLEPVPFRAI